MCTRHRSDDMEFAAGVARNLSQDRTAAARELVRSFRGLGTHAYPYRSALIMTDALAGHADDLVEQLTLVTSGRYQFFGGGAGDDAQFRRTDVFTDLVVQRCGRCSRIRRKSRSASASDTGGSQQPLRCASQRQKV